MDAAALQTCGQVALEAGTQRLMPQVWVFKLWWVIYGLLGMFVLLQALPSEKVLPGAAEQEQRDADLAKVVMVRGVRRERCWIGFCNERVRLVLPMVHRWRLTARSHRLVKEKVSWLFVLSCVFNVVFLVAWQVWTRGNVRGHAWWLTVPPRSSSRLCWRSS